MVALTDRNIYGARESNGLVDGGSYHADRHQNHVGTVCWTTPGLKITRLRLLSDPGFPAWDVSYCHGELNGKPVDVRLPFDQLPKGRSKAGRSAMREAIIQYARADRVYAVGLGIFNAISTLN